MTTALLESTAAMYANAVARQHEPSRWSADDEKAAHMSPADDPGCDDDMHQQRRVDDVLSGRWGL